MEPYFFGRSMHLFGIFHPSLNEAVRGGVIVAPPMLNEAVRSHFALREIAIRLSRAGYDVLRFDFSGCGDSFGDLTTIRAEDWVEDLKDAVIELREITGLARLSIFCARFGCCMASAVSAYIPWDLMVMWDPLIVGSDWITRLLKVNESMRDIDQTTPHGYLGEQTSPAFTESIAACCIRDIAARRIVSIITDNSISTDPSWDCRKLELDSRWEDSFLENLFTHQVIEETVKVFNE